VTNGGEGLGCVAASTHLPDEPVRAREGGVDREADADEAARDSILQRVGLCARVSTGVCVCVCVCLCVRECVCVCVTTSARARAYVRMGV
jgi:hypothetical protein